MSSSSADRDSILVIPEVDSLFHEWDDGGGDSQLCNVSSNSSFRIFRKRFGQLPDQLYFNILVCIWVCV